VNQVSQLYAGPGKDTEESGKDKEDQSLETHELERALRITSTDGRPDVSVPRYAGFIIELIVNGGDTGVYIR
jgi:hypothetical protein